MARLKQFDVTCTIGLIMHLICYSILICSILHLNWGVARLIQFDINCEVGLTIDAVNLSQYTNLLYFPAELAGGTPNTVRCNLLK